jgi:hypothetical protein
MKRVIIHNWFFQIDNEFEEAKHPRGQPGNAGQFGHGAGGGKKFEKSDKGFGGFGSGQVTSEGGGHADSPLPQVSPENNPLVVLKPTRGDLLDSVKKVTKVNVKDLQTWQNHIDPAKLRPLEGDPGPIEVAKINGKLVVMNGNHRAVSAFIEGKGEIDAKVADFDDPKAKKYWKKK